MIFLQPLLAAILLGFLFLIYFLEKTRLPCKLFFCLALAPAAGLSLCSLILFAAYFISGAQGKFLSILIYCLLTAFFLVSLLSTSFDVFPVRKFTSIREFFQNYFTREKLLRRENLGHLGTALSFGLFLAVFYYFLKLALISSAFNPYGGWDTRFFWNVKASFYFRDPALWKNMFSPIIIWTHPDYPLMYSGSVAWGWNWIGKEVFVWPAVVSVTFFISMIFLIIWYIMSFAPAWCAWIAGAFFLKMPLFPFWAINQYADVPLSLFIAAAGALTVCAFRLKDRKLFFLAGWMAGIAVWTKNEGIFFLMEFLAVLGGSFILIPGQRKEKLENIKKIFAGLAVPCAAIVLMRVFLVHIGDYLGSGRTLGNYLSLLFQRPDNTKIILSAFPVFLKNWGSWNGLWFYFLAAIPAYFILGRNRTNTYGGILAVLTVLNLAGYIVALHLTPHDVAWQISTALYRLLLHSGGLAVLFVFEVFSFQKQTA